MPFEFTGPLGPEKVIEIFEPTSGLKAVLVIDNLALGPAIGGIRMAPDVSVGECFRLARAMTLKNAAARLRHGGGKAVVFADPAMPRADKERLIRALAGRLKTIPDYIPGPDMGTDERAMAWIHDETGRAVGLPAALGGIPLDEIGATGFGLVAAIETAAGFGGPAIRGARVAVQGFGAVGRHAARFLGERGAVLVAASDHTATLLNPQGLDVAALWAFKTQGGHFTQWSADERAAPEAVIAAPCDILIPAARPDVLTRANAGAVQARLVAQGANVPATAEAEALLERRGILILPDFIANAGGVICAAVEFAGGGRADALRRIEETLADNTREMLTQASRQGVSPRKAAETITLARLEAAMALRRSFAPPGASPQSAPRSSA